MDIIYLSKFKNLKHIKTQGSGKIFIGVFNNERYYIKEVLKYMPWNTQSNEYGVYDYELVLNEILAGKIYNNVYHVPAVELYLVYNDTKKKIQRFLIASKEVFIDSCQKVTRDCSRLYNNKFEFTVEPFLVDCILANWDVAANGNIGVVSRGKKHIAFRLDVGGALKYRALGAPRDYRAIPTEHTTMLSNENISSTLFVSITKKQVEKMYQILENADLSNVVIIKRNIIKSMKSIGELTKDDIERVKSVFDTLSIMKKRHMFYIKNKQHIQKEILSDKSI